jgi:soluble lytic murein transglycosylase-like protein
MTLASLASSLAIGHAADRMVEHVTLANGFDLICDHHEKTGDRMRLYTEPNASSFIEVPAAQVASFESITVQTPVIAAPPETKAVAIHSEPTQPELTKSELHELLSSAGASHNLDVNLLASVVRAESGGRARAVSKTGAKGLMQLMPKTAAELGVSDSFRPDQNIAGGSAYLDSLLTRYHDKLALALAAYNAGPAAVDRYHGIPPYRETRLYVARIIRDFNASVIAARLAQHKQDTASAKRPSVPAQGVATR